MRSDPPRIVDLEGGQPAEVELMRAVIRGGREELPPLSAMPNALRAARIGQRSWSASSHLLWPGVSALALSLAVGIGWFAWPRTTTVGPIATVAAPVAAPSESRTTAATDTTTQPAREAAVTEPAPVPVESLPSTSNRPVPVRPASSAAPSAQPSPEASCSDEVDLIDDADAALRAGDAARALALTEQHAARCPAGTFLQERERIAIEALSKLGRMEAMRDRARAFEERFPSSPHRRRVRAVVDQHRDR